MAIEPLNWAVIKNPINWVIVMLMLALGALAGTLILSYFEIEPAAGLKSSPSTVVPFSSLKV